MHIVIIWQRFLPYHVARIKRLHQRLGELGHRLTAIEVASQDFAYGFPETEQSTAFDSVCCFPGIAYHTLKAAKIGAKVQKVLAGLDPDLVLCPATLFPERMAAITYRSRYGKRVVIMDDAWEHTDRKGFLTHLCKRLIHRNCDGVFVPAASHFSYWVKMGFPRERIFVGVNAVDNHFFKDGSDEARANSAERGPANDYFL